MLKEKGMKYCLLDSPIISHLIQKLESDNENMSFVRVDADHIDNLIKKEEYHCFCLSDEDERKIKKPFRRIVPKSTYTVQFQAMIADAIAIHDYPT
jgi:molecular chaperone HtpG